MAGPPVTLYTTMNVHSTPRHFVVNNPAIFDENDAEKDKMQPHLPTKGKNESSTHKSSINENTIAVLSPKSSSASCHTKISFTMTLFTSISLITYFVRTKIAVV